MENGTKWTRSEQWWAHGFADVVGRECIGTARYATQDEALAALAARQASGFGLDCYVILVSVRTSNPATALGHE